MSRRFPTLSCLTRCYDGEDYAFANMSQVEMRDSYCHANKAVIM